ncbi:hypothetical protein FO519_000212 [Halicephalobus sp. NKZ332]|nr:hypothetical protein FO519_000212 [Halicephalobus sp. NKZ332]
MPIDPENENTFLSVVDGGDIWKSHALFLHDDDSDIPTVFSELDKYVVNDKKEPDPLNGHWTEATRWIKFEEVVDEEGKRWSKPHVPILNANSLFLLKEHFLKGPVYFDMQLRNLQEIIDFILNDLIDTKVLSERNAEVVKKILMSRHCREPLNKNRKESTEEKSPKSIEERKTNTRLLRKLPKGSEATNILVSQVEFLEKPLIVFVRLAEACSLGNLTEVSIPTRFLFFVLASKKSDVHAQQLGRALGVLMSDELFRKIAYKTKSRKDMKIAVSEYIHNATVLPPCSLDPNLRIEPSVVATKLQRRQKLQRLLEPAIDEEYLNPHHGHGSDPALKRTGKFAGGLIADVRRKAKWYISDYTDSFNLSCVSTFCFMYFALLSPIVTFGGLLEEATQRRMAAMENLFSGAICGIAYHMFSGQPLTIIGSTGPVLVFETIMFDMCTSFGWDYLSFRTWVNLWTAVFLLIVTLTDSSSLVAYITRFTEESFAALIAFIFIYEAFTKLIRIKDTLNVIDIRLNGSESCMCVLDNGTTTSEISNCPGRLIDDGCYIMYDKILMSIVLMSGTFILSTGLKKIRTSGYLPTKVREVLSDFAVIISISIMTGIDMAIGINTPKLTMPSSFTPTYSGRGWFIYPFNGNPPYTALFAAVPALLACILVFLDQQITTVIINRKENKLKKGCGYHLDLFVLSLLIIIVGYLGIPIYVAATVLSINHVNSLKIETEALAPGEPQQFLGIREQRVTGIITFVLIGISVFMTRILCHIPMPVLYGVFLYMGITALGTLNFFERICLLFMPMKYQPDRDYIRHVPIRTIHFYTLLQVTCLGLLWVVKSIKSISIAFPITLIVMIVVRKLMESMFSPRHLRYLDDPMPAFCGQEDSRKDESISSFSSVPEIPQDRRLSRYSIGEGRTKSFMEEKEKLTPLIE